MIASINQTTTYLNQFQVNLLLLCELVNIVILLS